MNYSYQYYCINTITRCETYLLCLVLSQKFPRIVIYILNGTWVSISLTLKPKCLDTKFKKSLSLHIWNLNYSPVTFIICIYVPSLYLLCRNNMINCIYIERRSQDNWM